MFISSSQSSAYGDKFLGKKFYESLDNFFFNETKTLHYFHAINAVLTRVMLTERKNQPDLKTEFSNSIFDLMQIVCDYSFDEMTSSIADNYSELFDNILKYVDDLFTKTDMNYQVKIIKEFFDTLKKQYAIHQGYSLDDAFAVLFSKDGDENENILVFIKTILLSNDYFNADKIFMIRKGLLANKGIDDEDLMNFSKTTPSKNVLSLFHADYKVLLSAIKHTDNFSVQDYKEHRAESFYDILLLIYCRFIINMYIFICQSRTNSMVYNIKNDDDEKDFNEENIAQIILRKIYLRIEFKLFLMASYAFSEQELTCYFMRLLCDEICLRERATIGPFNLKKYVGLKASMTRIIEGEQNDAIIDEMKNSIIRQWDDGVKHSHAQMIEFLKMDKKYANALEQRGVETKLKKILVEFCKNTTNANGERRYPYIQGIDIFSRLEKVESKHKTGNKKNSVKSDVAARKKAKKMA